HGCYRAIPRLGISGTYRAIPRLGISGTYRAIPRNHTGFARAEKAVMIGSRVDPLLE
ncbi:MAG: hypothetical protein H7095_05850, partial [Pseudopedobacter sp.]|nr:hypothetical protein [Deinococcales bacterium]